MDVIARSEVKKEAIDDARKKGVKVHFASLMDIFHLKNAELHKEHQKYKGRVVLRGDIVKDDSGFYAVFTEQGSSASQMTEPPTLKPDEHVATTRWQALSVLCFLWSSRSRGVAQHERRPPVTEPRFPSTSRLILPTSDGWETRNGHRDGLLRSCVAQFPRGFGQGSCGQQEQ